MSQRMAVRVDGAWQEIGEEPFEVAGQVIRRAWLVGQDPAELEEKGISAAFILVADRPAGVRVVSSSLVDVDGYPEEVLETLAYTEAEIATMRAVVVETIQTEARRRILAVMDSAQQANALALGQELLTLSLNPDDWPEDDRVQHTANVAKWATIKAIRAASNAIEQALPNDAAALLAFDPAAAVGWPQ